ncbi:MAG: PilT/PilU family type 4a pilus ATPase [Planctomycetes bacterium]|nr:PilT/PilU family type 4a pilus ATPase [Planctomycetota bacterium]
MMEFDDLLGYMVQEDASDLILKTGGHPSVRIDGVIKFLSEELLSAEYNNNVVLRILDEDLYERFMRDGEVDAVFVLDGVGRFRVNVYRQSGEVGMVFRYIKSHVPDFESLHLPAVQLKKLASLQRGMILATGVAGCGKSTTLAAIVEHINRNFGRHVVTIEDPIEFVFEDRCSVISQREIGLDSRSFTYALKHVVRQSPDVIMIGEMRDKETMDAAINAAETGHLVLSTLHTVNAVQTVERIISLYPPHQHELIRLQLGMVLEGVISLRLIARKDGRGRVPAVELMMNTPTIRDCLVEGRTKEIGKFVMEGAYFGSQTFNQSLQELFTSGIITYEDAMSASDNPDELALALRGITKGTRAAHHGVHS